MIQTRKFLFGGCVDSFRSVVGPEDTTFVVQHALQVVSAHQGCIFTSQDQVTCGSSRGG